MVLTIELVHVGFSRPEGLAFYQLGEYAPCKKEIIKEMSTCQFHMTQTVTFMTIHANSNTISFAKILLYFHPGIFCDKLQDR